MEMKFDSSERKEAFVDISISWFSTESTFDSDKYSNGKETTKVKAKSYFWSFLFWQIYWRRRTRKKDVL